MTLIAHSLSFLRPAVFLTALTTWFLFPGSGFGATSTSFPVSVFDYGAGKDPFFPNRAPRPITTPDSPKKEALVFKGVAGSSDRPVALINDRTFTKGETGEIKVGTNTYLFRVIDIKEKSVIIERNRQTNELPLIDHLLPLDGRK